jgi:dTDP-4-dehydrorhamnose reductase
VTREFSAARLLITGAGGQLGQALARRRPDAAALARADLDVADFAATRRALRDLRPAVVLNTAAFTDVERCEQEPDLAYIGNCLAPQNLAVACAEIGAALVHVSTNCVFDGQATTPYREHDRPSPISVYGQTKLAGEEAIRAVLPQHYIVRTSWLFGHGRRNFVRTVLRLADERGELAMVVDEVACPTYAEDLAEALLALAASGRYGTYHLTNAGACSRHDFACRILALSGRAHVPVRPIALAAYRRLAAPPPYSALDNVLAARALGIALRPWEDALRDYLAAIGELAS